MINITEKIQEELKQARETCEVSGETSNECEAAWEAVEESAALPAPEEAKAKNSLEVYCDDNPDALECRLYED
jgi:uncharacterized protein YgiB involved in biofilm formation